ncbi:hypothetical protein [Nonomuraea sp. NPDC050786]|uniref:hypothetical protein n=1 Tax=Nonomuraea sp. NPDC050786 TaxID=3154840 RepID=UPI0033F02C79
MDLYPKARASYFRGGQVSLLAVWGANDGIFGPGGARAFPRDLPEAEVRLLDCGYFALKSHLDVIAGYKRGFLGKVLG